MAFFPSRRNGISNAERKHIYGGRRSRPAKTPTRRQSATPHGTICTRSGSSCAVPWQALRCRRIVLMKELDGRVWGSSFPRLGCSPSGSVTEISSVFVGQRAAWGVSPQLNPELASFTNKRCRLVPRRDIGSTARRPDGRRLIRPENPLVHGWLGDRSLSLSWFCGCLRSFGNA